jgi:preprotein translocase subunit SecG
MGIVIGLLSFILVLVCLLLGLLVLIQLPKKEAGLGMAFGSGAVDTLLGAGAGSALTKITKWVGGIFLGLCMLLAWLNNKAHNSSSAASAVREAAIKAAATTTPVATPAVSPLNLAPAATNATAVPTNVAAPK